MTGVLRLLSSVGVRVSVTVHACIPYGSMSLDSRLLSIFIRCHMHYILFTVSCGGIPN